MAVARLITNLINCLLRRLVSRLVIVCSSFLTYSHCKTHRRPTKRFTSRTSFHRSFRTRNMLLLPLWHSDRRLKCSIASYTKRIPNRSFQIIFHSAGTAVLLIELWFFLRSSANGRHSRFRIKQGSKWYLSSSSSSSPTPGDLCEIRLNHGHYGTQKAYWNSVISRHQS